MVNRILMPALMIATVLALLAAAVIFTDKARTAQASVPYGSEYVGTTTSTGRFQPETAVLTNQGTLGSIVITGAGAGVINLYDATTSDSTKRTGNTATSSILVASIPASAAAGTYTFDTQLTTGLYVSIVGTMPTTTITYRSR